jgi:hypothetical protein
LLTLVSLAGVSYGAGERLIGTWIVDADKTLAYIREHPSSNDDENRHAVAALAPASFTYDGHYLRCSVVNDKSTSSQTLTYHVLLDSQDIILIETLHPEKQVKTRVKVKVDGELIWTTSAKREMMFAFRKTAEPNKALVPTTPSVTPAADAPVAPAGVAAHL